MTPNKHERYTGDVHLGRRFTNGVPMHRRGEREETMYLQLEHELTCTDRDIHIQPGDIFNEFSVSEAIVLRTAAIYKRAAKANPHVNYIILRGNHDAVRDADKRSSFDVFQELMAEVPNVVVASEVEIISHPNGLFYGLMPWHPFKSSTELAMDLLEKYKAYNYPPLHMVVTHCEIKSFGGSDDNLLPLNVLKHCTDLVMNGHIHQPQVYEAEGVTVLVTGSMQPYAHGEDVEDKLYRTMTLEEALALTPEEALYLNIRVLLKEGEVLPDINCASLISKKVVEGVEREEGDIEVEIESFDMTALFKGTLDERGVSDKVQAELLHFFSEKKHG